MKEAVFIKGADAPPTMTDAISVNHKLELIMIDGKVCTALSGQTNCGCKPLFMNKLEVAKVKRKTSIWTRKVLTIGPLSFITGFGSWSDSYTLA